MLSPSSINSFHTVEGSSSMSDTCLKSSDQTTLKNLPSIEEPLNIERKLSSEDTATITKQPVASNKLLHQQETQDYVDDVDNSESLNVSAGSVTTPVHSSFISAISEEGSTSESVHSASTSSTLTIVDVAPFVTGDSSPLTIHDIVEREPLPSTSSCSLSEEKFESFEPNSPSPLLLSMNAGEIRKNLDKVDRKSSECTKTINPAHADLLLTKSSVNEETHSTNVIVDCDKEFQVEKDCEDCVVLDDSTDNMTW